MLLYELSANFTRSNQWKVIRHKKDPLSWKQACSVYVSSLSQLRYHVYVAVIGFYIPPNICGICTHFYSDVKTEGLRKILVFGRPPVPLLAVLSPIPPHIICYFPQSLKKNDERLPRLGHDRFFLFPNFNSPIVSLSFLRCTDLIKS